MPVRRLLGGFFALAGTTLVTQVVGFVALAVAARRLGPTNLGAATFALNVALYFGIPANFGVTIMGIRDVAREPERTREIAREVLTLRLGLGILFSVALVALTPVLAVDDRYRSLLPVAAATVLVGSFGGEWVLLGQQRMWTVGIARLVGQGVYGVCVLLLLTGGLHGARLFCWLTAGSIALTALVGQVAVRRSAGTPRISLDLARVRRRLLQGVPFGVAVVMVQIYFSIDSVMLGYLAGPAEVGQYSVAYKIPLALYGVVSLWSASLYPQVARLIEEAPDALRQQVATFTTLSLGLALPLGAGATVLGPALIPVLFGSSFRPAGTPFALLMWALAVALVTVNFGAVLAAGGDERRYAWGVGLGAGVNVAINIWAIPAFGTIGAGAATIASELVVVAYLIHRYRRVIGPVQFDAGRVARAAVAASIMTGVLLALPDSIPVIVRAVIGGAVYLVAAIAFGALRAEEIRTMLPGRAAAHGAPSP